MQFSNFVVEVLVTVAVTRTQCRVFPSGTVLRISLGTFPDLYQSIRTQRMQTVRFRRSGFPLRSTEIAKGQPKIAMNEVKIYRFSRNADPGVCCCYRVRAQCRLPRSISNDPGVISEGIRLPTHFRFEFLGFGGCQTTSRCVKPAHCRRYHFWTRPGHLVQDVVRFGCSLTC